MSRNAAAKRAGYKDFFHFLASYGLNIHKEEHVEEGVEILRALSDHDAETTKYKAHEEESHGN